MIQTNVGGPLSTNDPRDTYPTHLSSLGKGGFRSVATLAARDAIPLDRREDGMEVKVSENGLRYSLGPGLTNADWTVVEIVSGAIIDRGIL